MVAQYLLAYFTCAMVIGNFKPIEAIVCPKYYCSTDNCVNETSCEPGYALAPTFCGCCENCVRIIRK